MIIAYASAHADPINNPIEDAEIDLSTATLPASVTLYGDAVDTADPTASFSWTWTLLDPTTGTVPTLSSTTTQNITVSNISAWHNIRLRLIATNSATSETSETDVLLAPSASFVEIRVLSERASIQKPAKGSRSWHPVLEAWADAIETPALSTTDLSDISSATGAQLDILVSGSDAVSGGTALHTHEGAHIDHATTTAVGVIQLEEASSAVGAPKTLTRERITFTGTTGRVLSPSGVIEEIITTGITNPASAFIFSRSDLVVRSYSASLATCGTSTDPYELKFVMGSVSDYQTLSMTVPAGQNLTLTPTGTNQPLAGTTSLGAGLTIPAGHVFGLAVTDSPSLGDGGQILTVTIECERVIV